MTKGAGAAAGATAAGQKASSGKADPLVKAAAHFDTTSPLTLAEFNAAKLYQAHGYTDINGFLRGQLFDIQPIQKGSIAHLDSLINRTVTNKPLTLYRGVEEFAGFKPSQLRPGDVLSDAGFFSTSIRKSSAEGFASEISGKEGAVFSISVPKGTKTLPIFRLGTGSSFQASEREVLLGRNTSIRVKSARKGKDGIYRVKAELVQ